jgi:hypothetical protein
MTWWGSAVQMCSERACGRVESVLPVSLIVAVGKAGTEPAKSHIGGMRQHAILMIAAGAMMALSVFFALRPHQVETGIRPPY